jgi:hypothetical protein
MLLQAAAKPHLRPSRIGRSLPLAPPKTCRSPKQVSRIPAYCPFHPSHPLRNRGLSSGSLRSCPHGHVEPTPGLDHQGSFERDTNLGIGGSKLRRNCFLAEPDNHPL